jgi:hypothetical protein
MHPNKAKPDTSEELTSKRIVRISRLPQMEIPESSFDRWFDWWPRSFSMKKAKQ